MLKQLRQTIIQNLFAKFHNDTAQLKQIENKLLRAGINTLPLDHFALVDLPGPHTGISVLAQLFSAIGYLVQGRGYLASKQNDFVWLTEIDSKHSPASSVLPQVVVADFRLDEMPLEVRNIIDKYGRLAPPSPLAQIQDLIGRAYLDDFHAAKAINDLLVAYLNGRDWPAPSYSEFQTVWEFNQLLAWVLIFGRRPNHFTVGVHLLQQYPSLNGFLHFIEHEVDLALNEEGGRIKGTKEVGIEQGSTLGDRQRVLLPGGEIEIRSEFVEFIWRHPRTATFSAATPRWEDYHLGFIPQHANRIVESLLNTDQQTVAS